MGLTSTLHMQYLKGLKKVEMDSLFFLYMINMLVSKLSQASSVSPSSLAL